MKIKDIAIPIAVALLSSLSTWFVSTTTDRATTDLRLTNLEKSIDKLNSISPALKETMIEFKVKQDAQNRLLMDLTKSVEKLAVFTARLDERDKRDSNKN